MKSDMIAGVPVLFVMASKSEYGPALKAKITPLMTGIGPIEAAIALTATLESMTERPRLIVSLGSAGSRSLAQAELYQATAVAYRDMDVSPLGYEPGCTPNVDLPALVPLPLRLPGMPEATLSTGGNIVTGAAYDAIAEDMVDMETFALLRVTQRYNIPLLALRGISDGADDVKKLSDWTQYLDIIDEKLAATIDTLEDALKSGAITV